WERRAPQARKGSAHIRSGRSLPRIGADRNAPLGMSLPGACSRRDGACERRSGRETDPMADLTGRRLGPYDLTRNLRQGGMGAVYVGVHRTLQSSRAIKVLLPHEVDEGVVERFVREGQISASLRHPNIVEIYDVGEENESHFLVMELIEGDSLLQLLRRTGALP